MGKRIILVAAALAAFGAAARAESIACEKTETQAECFARLKCKPNEELDACQKRIAKCTTENNSLDTCKKGAQTGGSPRDNTDQREGDRGTSQRERERERDGRDGREREPEREHERDRDRNDGRGGGGGRSGRRRQAGGRGFEANKTFGLGLELGEPSGLTGKVFVTKSSAIDFGVGYIYDSYYYGDGVHLYADYLWHPTTITSTPSFELPIYIGAGLRFWNFSYCVAKVCTVDGSTFGIRVPFGIAFDFNNVPLDVFIELVPVLDFVRGAYYDRFHDRSHLGIDLSVGIRFWFK